MYFIYGVWILYVDNTAWRILYIEFLCNFQSAVHRGLTLREFIILDRLVVSFLYSRVICNNKKVSSSNSSDVSTNNL